MNHSLRVTADYPEQKIIQSIVDRLMASQNNVLLGYLAIGIADDLVLPAFLIQLESFEEQVRQEQRIKALMTINLSAVTKTSRHLCCPLVMSASLPSALRRIARS